MLAQLFYVSKRSPKCSDEDIEKILQVSVENNAKKNITGVLLYSKEKFLQCIEGELSHLLALYDKIKLDSRHSEAIMLGLVPVKERNFPSWQMAGKSVDLNKVDFKSQMSAAESEEFESILSGKASSAERVSKIIQLFFK